MTSTTTREVRVNAGRFVIDGDLVVPGRARGVVVFAHGSGSSRHSPRNRLVAEHLNERGLATMLIDLLTVEEEHVDARTHELRFDVDLLASRLDAASRWVVTNRDLEGLAIGYFGASTGAAAALVAAARSGAPIEAVVSRGGRPDLAGAHLPLVAAPTLLIVGGLDVAVLEVNRDAYEQLRAVRRLEIVPGATHLFEEAGALERVAALAADWFVTHLGGSGDNRAIRSPDATAVRTVGADAP